jgi:glycosyltransferase involved in cell wall biosynthesis
MRITIVNGFFLPVPPVSGGSTETSWYLLAQEFAARGHAVTMISRRWRGVPDSELENSVTHRRLPGFDHSNRLWKNLIHDWIWSWRVFYALPPADLVIVNATTLPIWLGTLRPSAGCVVLPITRIPRGQFRHYRKISRILAPSRFVGDRIAAENAALASTVRVVGIPLNWALLNSAGSSQAPFMPTGGDATVTIGFVGRLHEEKGLLLLADALKIFSAEPDLPPWRLLLCGPCDAARGGSGVAFRSKLLSRLSASIRSDRFNLLNPEFNDRVLAGVYRRISVFCYPSLAGHSETFGLAVAEAMACGCVPVVSGLPVFAELVRPDVTGLAFDHAAPDAPARLASALSRLVRDPALRLRLSSAAQSEVRRFDYPHYADDLLADLQQLVDRPATA